MTFTDYIVIFISIFIPCVMCSALAGLIYYQKGLADGRRADDAYKRYREGGD